MTLFLEKVCGRCWGDLFAWLNCVHRVYVDLFIVVCDMLYLLCASSCALYHSCLWFIEGEVALLLSHEGCCASDALPDSTADTVDAHREEFFKCLFPPSVLMGFLLVV